MLFVMDISMNSINTEDVKIHGFELSMTLSDIHRYFSQIFVHFEC